MLAILSPAKTQDFSKQSYTTKATQPQLLSEAEELIKILKKKSRNEIGELMHVSDKIADLNFTRFQEFSTPFTKTNAKQSLLAFQGDVYRPIDIEHYSAEDFAFAQDHIRSISGLYGYLRPLDLMQAYRLEMKTKLQNTMGKDLYSFWGSKITNLMNKELKKYAYKEVVNLASNEYAKAIQFKELNADIITPVFKEKKGRDYKVIAIYSKLARGMMADFIVKKRIDTATGLKKFTTTGYKYSATDSNEKEWVFLRG